MRFLFGVEKFQYNYNIFLENHVTLFHLPVNFEKTSAYPVFIIIRSMHCVFRVLVTGFAPNDASAIVD